jgi:ketosteroid isomerase-like protein
MKTSIVIGLTLLISVSLAFAQDAPEKVFRDLENQIAHAVIAKDAAQLNKLYASDYVSVGGTGQIWSRAEIVEACVSGRRAIRDAQIEKITVRQYPDTAIVVGFFTMSGKDGDKDISGRYVFTRVYKKESAEWRAVSFQATPAK